MKARKGSISLVVIKKEYEKNVYYCDCIYKDRIICNNSQSEGKDL